MTHALAQRISPQLEAEVQAALQRAAREPHRRSEILGSAALGLAARSQHPRHAREAPVLRALAERIAQAAMVAEDLGPATRDDFQETLEEFDQAHREFPGDMDVLARADDLHDLKTEGKGKRVSIAPLSWGAGATLGRSGQFKWDPSQDEIRSNIAQAATLAYWQGEPHEAQAIGVDLAPPANALGNPFTALPDPSLGIPETSARFRGIVSFGSDGAITRVPFDAGFGARFNLTGNYVAIQVAADPPQTGMVAGLMSYACSIGAFASPSVAPLFYTSYIDELPQGDVSAPIQRPVHATQILPILSNLLGGNVLLKFYGQGAQTVLNQFSYPIGQLLNPIPLPAEVQYVTLTNTAALGAGNFRIPFQLSL